MIQIRFADAAVEHRALGFLARRFSLKTWATGVTLVPEAALIALAREGISFTVVGPATYEQYSPTIRDPSAPAI
jgi:hypothetical protein